MKKNNPVSVFWFRRDLRLNDNAGLYHALKSGYPVKCVFIFDTDILELLDDKSDKRVKFIHHYLEKLNHELQEYGSALHVWHGKPIEVWNKILEEDNVKAVFANHDYEPNAIKRDSEIAKFLKSKAISFSTFKDQCIFEKDEVMKDDGKPYTVFTPYKNKWRNTIKPFHLKSYPNKKYFKNFFPCVSKKLMSLKEIGFVDIDMKISEPQLSKQLLKEYAEQRNFPAVHGTSRLSAHLRFGTVSVRELVRYAWGMSDTWVNEIIWRDFYMMILYHFPHVVNHAFKKEYEKLKWRHAEKDFEKWCNGQTGYPIVDAGMRQLNETGFMHNRVRMITASFLTKHLLIDWRWGEAYFAKKLMDFDLSANNGGWQWSASAGCDAAPYFRIFNPSEQTKKFDPEFKYISHWVPEHNTKDYADPIVEHTFARQRCLDFYKSGLKEK